MLQDFRYALRLLRKNPGFSAVALLTLALGIGANTAVFSVANTVLLRPLPYPESNRILAVYEKRAGEGQLRGPISAPDFVDWRRLSTSFSSLAVYTATRLSIQSGSEPERVPGARVSPGFLEVLGVTPRIGRSFLADEEQPGAERVAILGYGLWQRRGADPAAVGQMITVNGEPHRIVGILPADFRFPYAAQCDLLIPHKITPDMLKFRGIHQFSAVARLKPGVSAAAAQSELAAISGQLERDHPDTNVGHAASLLPLPEEMSRQLKPALRILLGAVFLVALIACANVANLLLARGAARRRELAVRAALGCTRWRRVRQSLAESALLAGGGSLLGLLAGGWCLELLRSAFFHRIEFFSQAGLDGIVMDWRVLVFTLFLAVGSTLFFGVSPALAGAGVHLSEVMRSGGRGSTGGERPHLRSALVIAEIALSLVLVTGAGLLGKSFFALLEVNPGFQPEHVLTAALTLPQTQYRSTPEAVAFYARLLERVRALPGVRSAAVTDVLPLTGDDNRGNIVLPGRTPAPGERWRMHPRLVSSGYLETMGIRLIEGRSFSATDDAGTRLVAIVSETTARQYWPGESAIGKRFIFFTPENPPVEIVGVAAAVRNLSVDREATPDVYVPLRVNPFRYTPNDVKVVVRSAQDTASLAQDLRIAVGSLDRSLPLSSVRPMEDYLDSSVAPQRFNLVLLGVFAVLALALAAAGLYGVMAYLVTQRTGEIGIRMALGARQGDVLRLVLRKGLILAAAGVAIGMTASLAAARVLQTLLYGVEPRDPLVFAAAPVALIAVAALASYLPARRASNVDPMVALRTD